MSHTPGPRGITSKMTVGDFHTIPNWHEPRAGMFKIYINDWWCVDSCGNPLFYKKENYPQCNFNREVTVRTAKRHGFAVKQLPVVYVPLRIKDYV